MIEYYEAQAKNQSGAGTGIRVARIPGQLERDAVFARIQAAVDPLMEKEVLGLTERLLGAIAQGDWPAYEELCAADMTCFEPEARGHLVEGLVRGCVWVYVWVNGWLGFVQISRSGRSHLYICLYVYPRHQEFHKFYFDNGNALGKHASTISQPR